MRHRYSRRAIPLAVILATLAARPAFPQTCLPPTDSISVTLLANMRHIASSTFPPDSINRVATKIPSAASATIVIVTQKQVCERALAAFNSAFPHLSPRPTKISVVKVGTVYVATHPLKDMDGWPHLVVDSKYAFLAKFVL